VTAFDSRVDYSSYLNMYFWHIKIFCKLFYKAANSSLLAQSVERQTNELHFQICAKKVKKSVYSNVKRTRSILNVLLLVTKQPEYHS